MVRLLVSVVALIALCLCAHAQQPVNEKLPKRVTVLPIFFMPKGEPEPTEAESKDFMHHLTWCRDRYRELIHGKTFGIARKKPYVYHADHDLPYYRGKAEDAVSPVAAELLKDLKYTRYTCPYILCSMIMNSHDGFPAGEAEPLNGGNNNGGGVVLLSSWGLDKAPNVQSTVQHELGHSFGLPHVDAYGYDMNTNMSIMSYNPKHHTDHFTPSKTPGIFIPEDLRALALNQRVFPGLKFDPKKDVPEGYKLHNVVSFGPFELP